MANIKKIKEQGNSAFLYDLKLCREVMVRTPRTGGYYKILKRDILAWAENHVIYYEVVDTIFVAKRRSMVIL